MCGVDCTAERRVRSIDVGVRALKRLRTHTQAQLGRSGT